MELSGTQQMFKNMSSDEKFTRMEAESKLWRFTCKHCNKEASIWDVGGIRYKATGTPSKKLQCPSCQKTAMNTIYKVEE